ncbi:S-layer homology domain-containing protein, partial [Dysosmobacter sp.]|uniref:S-layer homology domain-containing protein n=2 Tax=Dysosmobacter sp. TaxID=2591382 RepID=UPI003AF1C8DD
GAAAKIICNLILGPTTAGELHADTAPYKDVPTSNTFSGYIAYCAKEKIISGYADGTFRPSAGLTGYAFMKMLLGALGYDAANEGYTGANWSINVAKQAISIGLNDGLKGEFNGVKAVNREEACLYAFNTLNATMVEYTNQTIVIANGTVKTDKVAKDMENNARTETIKEDNKMQFAEKYFTNLEKEPTSDDFGRPANKWTYKNTDIGTYVDYTLMVAEYTDGVSGKDVYNKIGKTAMDKYDLTATIDGNDAAKTILADVNKNNKDDMAGTDTGVLTQVFVDDDNKAAAIVEINTYLGIADSDYSEKKDEAKFTVWGLSKEGKTYTKVAFNKDGTLKTTSDSASFTVSGEDFNVSKVEEDDAYLFTVAAGEVQTFVPAEAVKDTEITSFKKGSNVTAGGTKYSFNAAAYYDAEVLKDYTDGTVTNLKDTTYNIYLDTYGNLIGLEEVDAVDNYVFITGADNGSSNLSTKTNDANAIFLDGTSKVIEVSNTKGDGVADSPIVNKWFTYTVDKNGVYTLKNIKTSDFDSTKDKVGQKDQTNSSVDIDKKNITLNGNGDFKKVYGNADSIYLTATLKKVKNDKGYYAVISGADNVTTGVKNASIKTWTDTDAQKDVDKNIDAKDWKGTSSGVYTLFKDNGYVIAAVVVGEDAASSKNLVYATKNSVELESYDKNADEWTWTMKAVDAKGQEITLTEVSDSLSELKKIDTKGVWYQVKYDAKGNVISVEKASTALTGKKYITAFGKIEDAIDAEDTVLLETGALKDKLTLKGSTLYGNTNGTRGVVVDDATNVVFIQKNNNKETTSYENGVKAVETALKNLNEVSKGVYKYEFSAIIEDGIATTIVIRDLQADDYTSSTPGGGTTGDVTLVKFDATLRTIELKKADSSTDDDIKNAVKIALADNGYTWTEVTTTSAKAFLTSSSNNNNVIDFTVTVK